MKETAFAKINLALHVRGREADGYHRIETIFAFCEHGDVLSAADGEGLTLDISGPFAAGLAGDGDNLVLRAAAALGVTDVALTLEKKVPVASGIGGGSADAAAALRLLARFSGLPTAMLGPIAMRLGADVPACLLGHTVRGDGRGDRLAPVSIGGLRGRPALLVNPGLKLPTADAFAAWDGVDRGPLGDWRTGRNDLEAPARVLVPEIGDVLAALAGAPVARMSGSGATCFGLYDSDAERDAAAARIAAANPRWWVCQTRLR
jgi:4-diphosphocytidyl-2-C-methyl-D-erythritol kinase